MDSKNLIIVVVFIFLTSCMPENEPSPTSTTFRSVETPILVTSTIAVLEASPEPASTTSNELEKQGITIVGTVMDVSLSARIIVLTEPVEGFDIIALLEECELLSDGNDKVMLRNIQPGMRVQASGQAGTSGALLAKRILVFSDN